MTSLSETSLVGAPPAVEDLDGLGPTFSAWKSAEIPQPRRPSPTPLVVLGLLAGLAAMVVGAVAVVSATRSADEPVPPATPTPTEAAARRVEAGLGLDPVKVEDRQLARYLEEQGRLVRVGDGLAVSAAAYAEARAALVAECTAAGRITLARFRDLIGAGRKTAQLLLERMDADGVTRRIGDERVLRRAGRA